MISSRLVRFCLRVATLNLSGPRGDVRFRKLPRTARCFIHPSTSAALGSAMRAQLPSHSTWLERRDTSDTNSAMDLLPSSSHPLHSMVGDSVAGSRPTDRRRNEPPLGSDDICSFRTILFVQATSRRRRALTRIQTDFIRPVKSHGRAASSFWLGLISASRRSGLVDSKMKYCRTASYLPAEPRATSAREHASLVL